MTSSPPKAAVEFNFGHAAKTIKFWRRLVAKAARNHSTPFYVFSSQPIREALNELKVLGGPVPIRHWLSCKTQPFRPLLRWWRRDGRGIEVVSEFEFLAALKEGYEPGQILVNGPAKHHWLGRHAVAGLSINFDSLREMPVLLPLARALNWRVGVRCLTGEEFDPENRAWPTQFGLEPKAAIAALKRLISAGAQVDILHFHLRTNVASPDIYQRAIREAAGICAAARWQPKILDCGGGLPPRHTLSSSGQEFAAGFALEDFAKVLQGAREHFPKLQEIWLENGRFLSARSGALVVKVLDVKRRRGLRQLICDGGRTTNALVSNWEAHQILVLPRRGGPTRLSAVYGPTCMAFDQLARRQLPRSIREGDLLVWMEAGAYHIPWETRFSHGLATVLWHDRGRLSVARKRESFHEWWEQWKSPQNS